MSDGVQCSVQWFQSLLFAIDVVLLAAVNCETVGVVFFDCEVVFVFHVHDNPAASNEVRMKNVTIVLVFPQEKKLRVGSLVTATSKMTNSTE